MSKKSKYAMLICITVREADKFDIVYQTKVKGAACNKFVSKNHVIMQLTRY